MKTIKYFFIAILFNTSLIFAQSVDEIVDKYIEAIGGEDKIESIKNLHMSGTVAIMGMDAPFDVYVVKPDKLRINLSVMETDIVQALDGETGWTINPMTGDTGIQEIKAGQLKDLKSQTEFEGKLYKYKDKGNKITLEGKEDIDGKSAFKLKIIDKNGDSSYYFIDKETNLNVRRISYRLMQGETVMLDNYLSEYKTFDGYKTPTIIKTVSDMQMMNREMKIEKFEFNKKIDKNIFKKPD